MACLSFGEVVFMLFFLLLEWKARGRAHDTDGVIADCQILHLRAIELAQLEWISLSKLHELCVSTFSTIQQGTEHFINVL